jgi:deoxyribodipyrimidine photo-lyase
LRGDEMGAPIVQFFFEALAELRATLRARGSDLALLEGDFATELAELARRSGAQGVFFNVDYEPAALARDAAVRAALEKHGLAVASFTDHVYYAADENLKADGSPYTVFTPFKRRWLERLERDARSPAPSLEAISRRLVKAERIGATCDVPKPESYGHTSSPHFPKGGEKRAHVLLETFSKSPIAAYADARNFPELPGTSHLSPHLRAGTIGIRTCVQAALDARAHARGERATGIETWLSELIWRDFYMQILANFPHVAHEPFVAAAKKLKYRNVDSEWKAWCDGRTGYPIVDAAMIQLNTYGWMHNRLRMIVASFLTKHLLIDYRKGERYFAQHLADYDLAANNGGWQWASSTGTDAAPYFRVFNPTLQSKKFDPDGTFIREMIPALAKLPSSAIHEPWTLSPLESEALGFRVGRDYPEPIVDHAMARKRALDAYAPVLGKGAVKT